MKAVLIIGTLLIALNLQGRETEQSRYNNLFLRQELLHKSYREIYKTLTDINQKESLKSWYRLFLKDPYYIQYYNAIAENLNLSILGKDYRQLLYYYAVTGQINQAQQTIGLYLMSTHTLLDNISNDPQAKAWNAKAVNKVINVLTDFQTARSHTKEIENCFGKKLIALGVKREFDIENTWRLNTAIESCVENSPYTYQLNSLLKYIFVQKEYMGAPFPISFSGYIKDNQVTLHNRLPKNIIDILNLGEQLDLTLNSVVPQFEKAYKDLSIEEFKELMPTPQAAVHNLFTKQEGFKNTVDTRDLTDFTDSVLGPWSGKNLGMYGQMLQAIRDAKESVFIDIFWMGGSIGMNLAKELFVKVMDDPNFSVIIITDNENKFQYGSQLDMIYRYMRAFSEKFTDRNFYITPAQINLKRTALPEFADLLITKNVVDDLSSNKNIKSILEHDGINLLAKSDHTKALIVDGKPSLINGEMTANGKAFIGSKNWTDSSGGANEDEVAEIMGPAVAIILNTFYYDSLEAFLLDTDPRIGGKMVNDHLQEKVNGLTKKQGIEKLLSSMDVIDRYKGAQYNIPYIAKGDSTVAPAQNNIYGTEMSPVEQNIQIILSAKHQILIDDQFLYDPKIIEALKVAKTKNDVEIYILLESLISHPKDENGKYLFEADGSLVYNSSLGVVLPNNLFIPELTEIGVKVKPYMIAKNVLRAMGLDQQKHDHPLLGSTFHLKSISADGVLKNDSATCQSFDGPLLAKIEDSSPVTVSGSANKDIMTMSGGFRESQVAVFDEASVITHDCLFWARWNDSPNVIDGLDFELPEQSAQFKISDKKRFLNFLRQVLFAPYNFTKELF